MRATLVLGADGRHSMSDGVRAGGHIEVPPIDLLGFKISRRPDERIPSFRRSGTTDLQERLQETARDRAAVAPTRQAVEKWRDAVQAA